MQKSEGIYTTHADGIAFILLIADAMIQEYITVTMIYITLNSMADFYQRKRWHIKHSEIEKKEASDL